MHRQQMTAFYHAAKYNNLFWSVFHFKQQLFLKM